MTNQQMKPLTARLVIDGSPTNVTFTPTKIPGGVEYVPNKPMYWNAQKFAWSSDSSVQNNPSRSMRWDPQSYQFRREEARTLAD